MGGEIIDPINSAAQGMMGVVGATMIAGTAIAGTSMLIRQMDRMNENSYEGKRKRQKKQKSVRKVNSSIDRLVY
jgi:hypothetical protein